MKSGLPIERYSKPPHETFAGSYTLRKSKKIAERIAFLSRPRSRFLNWFHSVMITTASTPDRHRTHRGKNARPAAPAAHYPWRSDHTPELLPGSLQLPIRRNAGLPDIISVWLERKPENSNGFILQIRSHDCQNLFSVSRHLPLIGRDAARTISKGTP